MNVYFDNAATTPLRPEVVDVMHQLLLDNFGNPSLHMHLGEQHVPKLKQRVKVLQHTLIVNRRRLFSLLVEQNQIICYCVVQLKI